MTSEGTSGRDGEHGAPAASDMASPSLGAAPASATARPAARLPSAGLAALVGVPSSAPSLARFVGVALALLACRQSLWL